MTYKVNDSVSVSILLDGQEIPLDAGNSLNLLHIVAGTQLTLPVLLLTFTDVLRVVPKMNLQDGVQLVVTIIGPLRQTRYFRVHSWSRTPAGDGYSYKIEAYWDSPKYWIGTAIAGVRGSSRSVIEGIGRNCGLSAWDRNTETSDSMLWMPGNRTYGRFCRDIARYGFANDKSHMVLVVDSTGILRYVDVNANSKPKRSVGFTSSNNAGEFLTLSDFQPSNTSGVNNQLAGYRHERFVQDAAGNVVTKEDEIQLDPDSRFPVVNTKVRDTQERGTISFSPINFGNVHSRYERAKIQNTRYNLLNSVRGEFVFSFQTDFEPTDNFFNVSPSELGNRDYDGEFTTTTKVVFITGSSYQEKLVAVKNGLEQ